MIPNNELEPIIDALWEKRDSLGPDAPKEARQPVEWALGMLDAGVARVAEPGPDGWTVNQWLKKAVLLSFRLNAMEAIPGGPGGAHWWDKVPSKFARLGRAGIRHARVSRGAGRDRPPRRLHRAGRGADAELRQPRRLCR